MIDLVKRKIQNLISDKKFSEILTGAYWALSARVIATGLGMVSSIIIARAYGAEVLGIVAGNAETDQTPTATIAKRWSSPNG